MSSLTAEQRRKIEENRLKAKERLSKLQRRPEPESDKSSIERKRPAPDQYRNASEPKKAADTIRPARAFSNFIEYDFSKIKDSKGGFMSDETIPEGMTLEEWEKRQREQKARQEPVVILDPEQANKCFECGSPELDAQFFEVFKCRVCKRCKEKYPEKYSLLTKTECRQDYLLTEPELKDEDLLPRLEKPNPHKTSYSNMMLYLRYQVEEYAFKKWGSAENLDAEYERRTAAKKARGEKKFLDQIRDIRRKTRTSTWRKPEAKHEHDFGAGTVVDGNDHIIARKCKLCGFMTEEILM